MKKEKKSQHNRPALEALRFHLIAAFLTSIIEEKVMHNLSVYQLTYCESVILLSKCDPPPPPML
jgi:hypothetical protein